MSIINDSQILTETLRHGWPRSNRICLSYVKLTSWLYGMNNRYDSGAFFNRNHLYL